mmetsp:Transcript_28711/g.92639  ORF Transcript_28711/g.92639 Transcript_28711/m.92639 type:complete len:234 (-) Transcript_28711:853-1554(-)
MCLYSQLLITSMPPREHPALSQLAHAGAESVKTFFQARPLQAQMLSAVVLSVLADLVAQMISRRRERARGAAVSWMSAIRLAVWSVVCTPMIHAWLRLLDAVLGKGTSWSVVTEKLLMDQLFWGPTFLLAFFTFVDLWDYLTGHRQPSSFHPVRMLREKVLPTHRSGMSFWIPVHLFNFAAVPSHLRILTISAANFIFNIMLALRASSSGTSPPSIKLKQRSARFAFPRRMLP